MTEKTNNKERHIMVDIETLGRDPGCVILSIGAIDFDLVTGTSGSYFTANIDLESSVRDYGFYISPETLKWWLSDEERSKTLSGIINDHSANLDVVLHHFNEFVSEGYRSKEDEEKEVYIWAKSPRFDLGILREAYNKIGVPPAWSFRNERDVRTAMHGRKYNRHPTHNPIDDCVGQIEDVIDAVNDVPSDV